MGRESIITGKKPSKMRRSHAWRGDRIAMRALDALEREGNRNAARIVSMSHRRGEGNRGQSYSVEKAQVKRTKTVGGKEEEDGILEDYSAN